MTRGANQSLASWVFGFLLLVALIWIFVFAPDTLPEYKQRMVGFLLALFAGLFAFFLTGKIGLEIQSTKSRWGNIAVKATGGIAIFVLVLVWWWSPLTPIEVEKKLSGIKQDTENIHQELNTHGKALNEIKELLRPLDNTNYRELVANVIYAFEPKSEIKIGSWIQGPDGARNIDIEVQSMVGGIRKLMAIEVVDLPGDKKAGVDIIDAFDSKRADIQADIALVCSNTGFDAVAIRKAKRKQIGLISVLHQGDPRVKAIIEEEIYLRKVRLGPMQISYTTNNLSPNNLSPNFKFQTHDLRYQGKSVDAWLQQRAAIIAASQPEPHEPITLKFDLKTVTEFEIEDRRVNFDTLSITFHPRTQWLAQIVRLDASTGIYDYLRGRVRLAGGTNSYVINGVNFDSAMPLSTPPPLKDRGIGLLPGEIDISLIMIEGLDLPTGMEIPKLEDLVRPENLEFQWNPSGTSAMTSGAPRKTKQSP